MKKGDIILVSFPFTDFTDSKLRPAVIIAVTGFDVTACFLTTKINNQEPTDILINPTTINGLKKQSLIKPLKITTIEKNLVVGKLGKLLDVELLELNIKLKIALQL